MAFVCMRITYYIKYYARWTTEITYKPSRSFLLLHIACSCYTSVYSRVSHITN